MSLIMPNELQDSYGVGDQYMQVLQRDEGYSTWLHIY
jgi:hypothetical protein